MFNDMTDQDDQDNAKTQKLIKRIVGLILILVLIVLLNPFAIVGAGSVGVITRFGAINRVAKPGIVLKIPVVERVHTMDTRTQKDQVEAQAASKDLQIVKSTIAVNYHLDGVEATQVYQNIGVDYQDRVISPAIQDMFKATTAQYTAEELITQREIVRETAEAGLSKKMQPYHIVVDNFNIVNFDFSPEFNTAIEAKQVAQQSVETAKQNLARIEVEAKQAQTQAQGQADAQKALKDTGALSAEYLQYLALTKWNGILPTYTGGAIPFVNIK